MVECRIPNEFALLEEGILTKDKIRKYPLSRLYVNKLIKIYAINTKQSYELKIKTGTNEETDMYITDKGLDMFYTFCETHNPEYVKKTLHMQMYNDEDLKNIRNMNTEGNMRMRGDRRTPCQNKKSPARVIIKTNAGEQIKDFDSLTTARQAVLLLLTHIVPENLKLYRKRVSAKKGTWYVEVPLVVRHGRPENKEGHFDKHRTIQSS